MNNRVEHCIYQAGLTAQGCWDEFDDYAKHSIERLVEVVVRECIHIYRLKHWEYCTTGRYIDEYEHSNNMLTQMGFEELFK